MIIARTPLRVSFVGGGSDLPSFYREFGGAVLSTSIDKYVYVTVNKKFDDYIRLSYSKTEEVQSVDMLEHRYVKEIMKHLSISGGVEITSIADIPSKGSGLGSSSTFTIAALHALSAYKSQFITQEQLALDACRIEIEKCGEPIGKQDQYAAACGGLNYIRFNEDDTVSMQPIICLPETKKILNGRLMMFYTGITRNASNILKEQDQNTRENRSKQDIMKQMVRSVSVLKDELENNRLDNFGSILHENWLLKKEMAGGVSNAEIDSWYDTAIKHGAQGGKILGAGGGGFLLFYVPEEKHASVRKGLSFLREIPFAFENEGSKIIFIH